MELAAFASNITVPIHSGTLPAQLCDHSEGAEVWKLVIKNLVPVLDGTVTNIAGSCGWHCMTVATNMFLLVTACNYGNRGDYVSTVRTGTAVGRGTFAWKGRVVYPPCICKRADG